jgi:hypothetical protein
MIVVSDNCRSALLPVGSEFSEQRFALGEIFKQGLTLLRVEVADGGLRFLRGQSRLFEPCSAGENRVQPEIEDVISNGCHFGRVA